MVEVGQVSGVLNAGTDALRKSVEEIDTRSWEPVAADERLVVAKSFLKQVVVQDRQGNRRLLDTACTDKSDQNQVFCEADSPFDDPLTSEAGARRWGGDSRSRLSVNIRLRPFLSTQHPRSADQS